MANQRSQQLGNDRHNSSKMTVSTARVPSQQLENGRHNSSEKSSQRLENYRPKQLENWPSQQLQKCVPTARK